MDFLCDVALLFVFPRDRYVMGRGFGELYVNGLLSSHQYDVFCDLFDGFVV